MPSERGPRRSGRQRDGRRSVALVGDEVRIGQVGNLVVLKKAD